MSARGPRPVTGVEAGKRIALIELRCRGLEHVPFNAALIAATLAACPDASVDVYGEEEHLKALEELLTVTRPRSTSRLSWNSVAVPSRKARARHRLRDLRRLFARLSHSFTSQRPDGLVVATIDPLALVLLKSRLLTSWHNLPTVAVFHELLAVLDRRRLRSVHWWGLNASLAVPHPRRLSYLVLSECIKTHLERIAPTLASRTIAIDHPSLLADIPDERVESPRQLRFGFVGGGRDAKGFTEFLELATSIRKAHPEVEFRVVGSALPDAPRNALAQLEWSDRKLPLAEFVGKLRQLTHVVWLGDPRHYRLVASGSLADAVALGIPVICLRGPFVDHLFERFGQIGVRCSSLADVRAAVLAIAANPESVGSTSHAVHLRAAQAALAPEASAARLEVLDRHRR